MKVLLDENLDHRLRNHLGAHEVFTASYKGWSGLKNGWLLRAAEEDGFEVFVTGDQTLYYEQNLTKCRMAIVALSSIEWRIVRDYLQEILAAWITRDQHPFRWSIVAPSTAKDRLVSKALPELKRCRCGEKQIP